MRENASQICDMEEMNMEEMNMENGNGKEAIGPTELEWRMARPNRLTLRVPAKDCLDCGEYLWVDLGPSETAVKAVLLAYAVKDDGKAVTMEREDP